MALSATRHCLRLATDECCSVPVEGNCDLSEFLASVAAVVQRSVCAVEWAERDTALQFIDKAVSDGEFADDHIFNNAYFFSRNCILYFYLSYHIGCILLLYFVVCERVHFDTCE